MVGEHHISRELDVTLCFFKIQSDMNLSALFFAPLALRLLSIATLLTCSACTLVPQSESRIDAETAKLEVDVKTALVAEPDLAAAAIDVSADDESITLEGFVERESQKKRAGKVALQNAGSRAVINNLKAKSR